MSVYSNCYRKHLGWIQNKLLPFPFMISSSFNWHTGACFSCKFNAFSHTNIKFLLHKWSSCSSLDIIACVGIIIQIQVLQMELGHERERTSILEERINQLRRVETGEGSTLADGQSETALELHLQEADSEMVRLRVDLLVSSPSQYFCTAIAVSTHQVVTTSLPSFHHCHSWFHHSHSQLPFLSWTDGKQTLTCWFLRLWCNKL